MNRRTIRWLPILLAGLFLAYQWFSSERVVNPETGRASRVGLSVEQEAALGLQGFQQVLSQSRVIGSGAEAQLVSRIASRLASAARQSGQNYDWKVALIADEKVNAFCLPGGNIVVCSGILPVARTEAALAAVMGHEMAHATSRHGSQRVLQQNLAQTALTGVAMSLGDMSYDQQRAIMGALGAGAQYGILMPFGRKHETEADEIGLLYMARAGYNPQEAIGLWERMEEAGGGAAPPEFLSTHPSHGTRIRELQAQMPRAMEEYRRARGDPAAEY